MPATAEGVTWAWLNSLLAHACPLSISCSHFFSPLSVSASFSLSLLIHFNYAIVGRICHRHLCFFLPFAYRMPYIVYVYRKCTCHALWLLFSLPPSVIMTTIRRSSNCSRKTVLRLRLIIIIIAYNRGWNPKDLARGEGRGRGAAEE